MAYGNASYKKEKYQDSPMDLDNIGIEQWGSMEKVDYSIILKYCLFQIAKSKSMSAYKSYAEMVELLEILLVPYSDEIYLRDMQNLDKQKKHLSDKTDPRKRENVMDRAEMEYVDKKLSALTKLLARNGFLAEKSIMA